MSIFLKPVVLLLLLLQTAYAQESVWRDIPANELGGIAAGDLAGRMRASMAYATKYGFGAGIPTFHVGTNPKTGEILYGTVLIPKNYVEFKDIPRSELGNVDATNFQERVRQAMTWATNHGYAAGIPTFFEADYGRGTVYGVILVKAGRATFFDLQKRYVRKFAYSDTGEWARVATDFARQRGYIGAFPTYHVGNSGTSSEVFGIVCLTK